MTPTREQYELAAKAAGIEIAWFAGAPNKLLKVGGLSYDREPWRPHEDRAQAFSLLCAIKGGLWFEEQRNAWYACFEPLKGPPLEVTIYAASPSANDIEAAACEAVFLCAVEVGRGMA